jgi:hypothetical protein
VLFRSLMVDLSIQTVVCCSVNEQNVHCAVHESWCVGGDVMSLAAWTQADSTQSVACGW